MTTVVATNPEELALATYGMLDTLYRAWKTSFARQLRFGQFFMNLRKKADPWPALYYTEDENEARRMIFDFMANNQNYEEIGRWMVEYIKKSGV